MFFKEIIINNDNIIYLSIYPATKSLFTGEPKPPRLLPSDFAIASLSLSNIPDVINSNQKFDVSLDRTLLTNKTKSECLCFNSHCTNLSSQSTEREKISTWDCRFWRPGCQSFSCLMHQSIPAAHRSLPPPSHWAIAGALPALSVLGVGHLQILLCLGAGHLPTPGLFPSFWQACGFLSEYKYT